MSERDIFFFVTEKQNRKNQDKEVKSHLKSQLGTSVEISVIYQISRSKVMKKNLDLH